MESTDLAARTAFEGFWEIQPLHDKPWDSPRTPVWYSPRYKELLGYGEDELENVLESWTSALHPEDREQTLAALSAHIQQGQPYEAEYRLDTKRGGYRWFRSRGQALWDSRGNLTRVFGSLQDVNERRQLVAALKQAEARYRSLVEHAPMGIGIHELDPDGCLVAMNPAMLDILDSRDHGQLIGSKFLDVIATPDRKLVADLLAQAYTGQAAEFEFRIIRDQSRKVFTSCFIPVQQPGGAVLRIMGIIKDITVRKEAEEALRASEARYRAIVEDQTEFIVRFTPDWTCTFVNQAFSRHFGHSDTELIGTSFLPYVSKDDQAAVLRKITSLMPSSPVISDERRMTRPDGSVSWQAWTDRGFFDKEGRLLEVQSVGRDISERKQAEEELSIAYERLRELTGRLKAAEEEERRRIALELHDAFGQALTGLKLDLAWMRRQLERKGEVVPVKGIQEKITTTTDLVDQMIRSVQRLATLLRPSILDDLGLIAALEWQARDFQDRTGARCELRVSPQVAERSLDHHKSTALFRIAQELLTNVARHANASVVRLTLEENDGLLTLQAVDDGKGIPEGLITKPTSLGLLGIRQRASLFGGTCNIQTAPDQGTAVSVQIPISEEHGKTVIPAG